MSCGTLKAYNTSSQTVLANGSLNLLNNEITGGCCGGLSINNNAITVSKGGTYLITVSANALATTNGNITLQLFNKGTAVPAAIASATGTTTDTKNLNFSLLYNVGNSCNCVNNTALLTLINTGVGATYSNIILNIVRV